MDSESWKYHGKENKQAKAKRNKRRGGKARLLRQVTEHITNGSSRKWNRKRMRENYKTINRRKFPISEGQTSLH